jgi:hypothetical protein
MGSSLGYYALPYLFLSFCIAAKHLYINEM